MKKSAGNKKRDSVDFLRRQFFVDGLQYYVAGLFVDKNFKDGKPVAAVLFHHAIERFLKGGLLGPYSLGQLKNFGHDLCRNWLIFKSCMGDNSLSTYDTVVMQLNKFEKLRYPDLYLIEDITLMIGKGVGGWDKKSKPIKGFSYVLDEIKGLVKTLSTVCKGILPPGRMQFLEDEAKKYLIDTFE